MAGADAELAVRQAFAVDFPAFAREVLRIRAKEGGLHPFTLNSVQKKVHAKLEAERARKGRVRAVVLKGRQMGISTLVGGRFYHRTIHKRGWRTFILTHEQGATDNLFDMVSRFHDNMPEGMKPSTGAANAKELLFDRLDSGYVVGTAGARSAGRSQTIQAFHGSEVAFWPNADEHAAGVMQAIPDAPDTEVILESTACGIGNYFHSMWQRATAGENGYLPVFVPWFAAPEYRAPCPHAHQFEDDEIELAQIYTLDRNQLMWRRRKIAELPGGLEQFQQEYPCSPAEAFRASASGLISLEHTERARRSPTKPFGPLVIGVDPAWSENRKADRTAIAWRRGAVVENIWVKRGVNTMELCGFLKRTIDEDQPVRVFIDVSGAGTPIVQRLREWGAPYTEVVRPVNFASKPLVQAGIGRVPHNRRAEMWLGMKKWLEDEDVPAKIPDRDDLVEEICAACAKDNSWGRLVLEPKEDVKKRLTRSPDLADAIALTFAEPVAGMLEADIHGGRDWYGRRKAWKEALDDERVSEWAA